MSRPKVFIGSSTSSLAVARLVADRLEDDECADVQIWNEGVFSLNQGYLEKLLNVLIDFDFAVIIWAPDDITESKGDSHASPRDNVIFECGLFMGAVGRERVFIICDQSVEVKIPSDLAGVTLATYDGSRVSGPNGPSAVRRACDLIEKEILRPRYPNIVGDWVSRYAATAELGHPTILETVEIKASRGGVSIVTKSNPSGDTYYAHGRIFEEKHIVGEWRAAAGNGTNFGLFVLTTNPKGTAMYGYCTAHDETNASVFVTWVLAKGSNAEDPTIKARLDWAQKFLSEKTIGVPLQSS